MQRGSNNASAFVTCQEPHYCHGMRPHTFIREWGQAARPVVQHGGTPWRAAGAGKMAPALHALPFPHGCQGPVGINGVKSPPRGAPRSPWASSPGKKARLCHQASARSQQRRSRPCFQSASRRLSPKHQNWTTFDSVGKSVVGHPFQECAPSAQKGSTRSFTVLKMHERTQWPPYFTWMQTPHRHESKTSVLLHTSCSFWVPPKRYRVLCTPAHTEMRGVQITHSSEILFSIRYSPFTPNHPLHPTRHSCWSLPSTTAPSVSSNTYPKFFAC